jgi:hypothetical protein
VYADIGGPVPVPTPDGEIYFALYQDAFTSRRRLYLMKRKTLYLMKRKTFEWVALETQDFVQLAAFQEIAPWLINSFFIDHRSYYK